MYIFILLSARLNYPDVLTRIYSMYFLPPEIIITKWLKAPSHTTYNKSRNVVHVNTFVSLWTQCGVCQILVWNESLTQSYHFSWMSNLLIRVLISKCITIARGQFSVRVRVTRLIILKCWRLGGFMTLLHTQNLAPVMK